MSYNSKYKGSEVDAALDLAKTALQEHQSLEGYTKDSELSKVAKSGSYNDLSDKPTIPSAVTESTISGWGFTKNTGTVTGVKVNGSTKSPSSGTVDIGNVVTSVKVNGTTYAPSSGVVDLGTISGGGGSSSGSTEEYITLSGSTATHSLESQKIYVLECSRSGYTFNFNGRTTGAQYRMFIYTGSYSPTMTFPIHKCANANELSFEQYKIYEISFVVTPILSDPLCTWTSYDYMKNMGGGGND